MWTLKIFRNMWNRWRRQAAATPATASRRRYSRSLTMVQPAPPMSCGSRPRRKERTEGWRRSHSWMPARRRPVPKPWTTRISSIRAMMLRLMNGSNCSNASSTRSPIRLISWDVSPLTTGATIFTTVGFGGSSFSVGF